MNNTIITTNGGFDFEVLSQNMMDSGEYREHVGEFIRKKSGRKFKSGKEVEFTYGLIISPFTGREAYTLSDSSFVECRTCLICDSEGILLQ